MDAVIDELICPICNEIPARPVRLKIINNAYCDDVFCEPCVIQILYHAQNTGNDAIKCPVCAQKVHMPTDDSKCYIEDRIIKKIIYAVVDKHKKISCVYGCGYENTIEKMAVHYKENDNLCNKKIIKCPILNCKALCVVGEDLYNHEKSCPYKWVICPFCIEKLENDKALFIEHLMNFHKFKTIQNIQRLI